MHNETRNGPMPLYLYLVLYPTTIERPPIDLLNKRIEMHLDSQNVFLPLSTIWPLQVDRNTMIVQEQPFLCLHLVLTVISIWPYLTHLVNKPPETLFLLSLCHILSSH